MHTCTVQGGGGGGGGEPGNEAGNETSGYLHDRDDESSVDDKLAQSSGPLVAGGRGGGGEGR